MLGPALFILYINDLPEAVQSSVKLFADDTKIYCNVSSISGPVQLQKDLDAATSGLTPGRCRSMRISAALSILGPEMVDMSTT